MVKLRIVMPSTTRSPLVLIFTLTFATSTLAGLPEGKPEALGFDASRLARVEDAVARAVGEKKVPGAVVLVGRRGKVVLARAFGKRSVEPMDELMTRDTVFDLASLTKPVATATSVMILLERGKIRLSDRIVTHLPELKGNGKDSITIEQLLRHRAGLIPDNPIADYDDGPESAWRKIAELSPQETPGDRFIYSDVGYLILGRLVEKVSGQSLDEFARGAIFDPLGMVETGFRPAGGLPDEPTPVSRIAPTEREGMRMLRGVVHDPRSRALGGVAGHAGLFSTADDLATYAQMILDGGKGADGKRVLSPLTVRAMAETGSTPEGQRRGLGWDVETSYSTARGSLFGPTSFGHTGFTGTSLWIDPETETFVILLTSRLHPDGKGASPIALRAEVATLVASSIVDATAKVTEREVTVAKPTPAKEPSLRPVDCGVDILARRGFRELKNKRVGLVTNHTGRTKAGVSTIDLLFAAPGVELVALFSPEHGIRGAVDAEVADSKDDKTGLPIQSLYGKTRKPTAEALAGVEILVYDIQDIGTRYYTYISTLGLLLEAAKENQIPLVVLDRPNPIGGVAVTGPVRDPDFASFIAHHAVPVRHGMTVGELARLFNAERSIGADLTVIPCEGWRRPDTFDRSGLEWVNPSPNMRSLTEALLYPGVGLLEASNLATGRGTDTPFERLGAPWIDDRAFAKALNEANLPGVRFVPVRFTPSERQYKGQECKGVQIAITDWSTFEPVDLGIAIAITLKSLYPRQWEPAGFLKMLADRDAYEALMAGGELNAIRGTWSNELAEFLKVRSKYLLYR
jgi:uncharacterized protein YbbC (DUF1343 family)/CubicO group peptidase (beta-lactamase class C family)